MKTTQKYESLKAKILNLLQKRNDLTRTKLKELLNKPSTDVDNALGELRKAGIKIWPSKGVGSPLKIAMTQVDHAKYIAWRRLRYLPTVKRMVI